MTDTAAVNVVVVVVNAAITIARVGIISCARSVVIVVAAAAAALVASTSNSST